MENEAFDTMLRELRENVTEIDNPPESELEQGLEWRECKRCGHLWHLACNVAFLCALLGARLISRLGRRKEVKGTDA